MTAGCHLHVEPRFLLEPLALRALQVGGRLAEVLDLEAEMMDAAVVRSVGPDIGGFLRFPIQDRQVRKTAPFGALRISCNPKASL